MIFLMSLAGCAGGMTETNIDCLYVVSASSPNNNSNDPVGEYNESVEDCEYAQQKAPKAEIYFEGIVIND